jgi:hypothetical protein
VFEVFGWRCFSALVFSLKEMVVLVLDSRSEEMAVALKKTNKKQQQRNRKLEWGPRLDDYKALTLTENSDFS